MYMEIGNLLKQGSDIVEGHVSEFLGLEKDLSESRMDVCKKCPLYKENFGGQCNPRLWLNPETGDVSTMKRDGFFKGCGCRLQAKTRLPGAHCPAHKW